MSVTRNTDLPQHSYGSGSHYGELPLAALPSSGANTGYIFYYSGSTWTITALSGLAVTGVGGSGSITVKEQDGSPSITNVTTIKFSGSTVTDEGSGVVLIQAAVGPSGSQGPSGSNTIDINDEGVAKGSVETIDFVGPTVTASVAGTVATVRVSASNLDGLSDVTITSPQHGETITYDSGSSTWKNSAAQGSRTFAFFMGG